MGGIAVKDEEEDGEDGIEAELSLDIALEGLTRRKAFDIPEGKW